MEHASSSGLHMSVSPALTFEVLATQGRARASRMTLPHFTAETPMFMPVGTQGLHPSCFTLCAKAELSLPAQAAQAAQECPSFLKGPNLHMFLNFAV